MTGFYMMATFVFNGLNDSKVVTRFILRNDSNQIVDKGMYENVWNMLEKWNKWKYKSC